MSRAESLCRLSARLCSLATLERCCAPGSPGGASGACGPDPWHGTCPSPRAPPLPARALVPISPRPLPAALAAPFCSIGAAPRGFPSRALPWRRPARSASSCRHSRAPRPTVTLSSHGARLALFEAPHRLSRALHLLDSTASVARKASQRRHRLRRRRSTATHEGQASPTGCGAAPNDRCCARFRVKPSRAVLHRHLGSDDDEHDTDFDALLLFGHAVVAPLLLSPLSALDEVSLALICRSRPRHLHHNPTGLPRGLRRPHSARPWAGGSWHETRKPLPSTRALGHQLCAACLPVRDRCEGFRGLTRIPAEHLYTRGIQGLLSPHKPQPAARVDVQAPEPRSLARPL